MKKLYTSILGLLMVATINAQTTIDISQIDAAYTKTVDGALVIDLATTASAIAAPKLSFANPFLGATTSEAEIQFDIYNYNGTDSLKVLGAIFGIYDATLGRMYFSNGSYLGYNDGEYYDANLINYGLGIDYLGGNEWKNVKLQFTNDGFALYVNNALAYNQNSTDITITSTLSSQARVITFLHNAATLAFGTGSWWSDNTRGDGTYWDLQYSYLKNITFSNTLSTTTGIEQQNADNAKVISTEYFNIAGAKVGSNYNVLVPGIYVKRELLNNGKARVTKIGKQN